MLSFVAADLGHAQMNVEQENELFREIHFKDRSARRVIVLRGGMLYSQLTEEVYVKITTTGAFALREQLGETLTTIARDLGMNISYDGDKRLFAATKKCSPHEATALKSMLTMVLSANYEMMI